ncbi:MAG: type VI secretion system contractile sheath large subunit [Pyrinomonadaceae bacterium]
MSEIQFDHFETIEEISLSIAAIDEIINLQLDEIFHHPEFKSLEATWCGLYHLVNQKESSLRVKIKIFQAGKRDLLKNFERAEEIEQSAIYEKVFSDIYQRGFDIPFGLLIGAYEFDHLPQDMTVIENMAEISAKAHAPFVAGVSPSMFYWESFAEVDATRDMSRHCLSTQYDRWNSFRKTANARYVGLCMPHILLREPYEIDKNFVFRESAEKRDLLWGNAAFAFAGCVARAYDEKSWLGKMRGIDSDGAVEDLCCLMSEANGKSVRHSLDADLSRHFPAISNQGFMPLIDDLGVKPYFFNSQSANKPTIYDTEGATTFHKMWSQLENILAASRFAVNLMSLWLDNFHRLNNEQESKIYLLNWLGQYYQIDTSKEVNAEHPLREFNLDLQKRFDNSGDYTCIIYIRPTYLLDDMLIAMRSVISLSAPGNSDN